MSASGNYSGISSVTLCRKCRWDITSNLLAKAEALSVTVRHDLKVLVSRLVENQEISEEMGKFYFQQEPPIHLAYEAL